MHYRDQIKATWRLIPHFCETHSTVELPGNNPFLLPFYFRLKYIKKYTPVKKNEIP